MAQHELKKIFFGAVPEGDVLLQYLAVVFGKATLTIILI